MKGQILICLILLSLVLTLNAQTWSGYTPGSIYYDQGNVTIGASTSNTANLHIGKQEAPANTVGEVLRLSLQPYGHTGGPWIFKTRDIPGVAFLDILYGTGSTLTINSSGNIGIGTTTPAYKLDVKGDANFTQINTSRSGININGNGFGNLWSIGKDYINGLYFYEAGTANQYRIVFKDGGNIGIGTTNPAYKLDVIGTIRASEIKVDLNGADFVFEKDYKLMPLNVLEKFVKEHKHLPEIAPAKEMEKNGTNLGNLNSKLLQKIEELTLYTIEQNKKIEQLQQQNNELQQLKEKITIIEAAINKEK